MPRLNLTDQYGRLRPRLVRGAARSGQPVAALSNRSAAALLAQTQSAVDTLLWQLRTLDVQQATLALREHQFHATRKWRFDLAWPLAMVAVEVDGGAWIGGRHTSGAGFTEDCIKLSTAAAHGWRVLRFTPRQVRDGEALPLVLAALRWRP